MFNCDNLRREIVMRWQMPGADTLYLKQWEVLSSKTPPPTAYHGAPNLLAARVNATIEECKEAFASQKAISSSMPLVIFDSPIDKESAVKWLDSVLVGPDRDDDNTAPGTHLRRSQIIKKMMDVAPAMKSHPNTEEMMNKVILPLRRFVVCQVVASLLEDPGDVNAATRAIENACEDHAEEKNTKQSFRDQLKKENILKPTKAEQHAQSHTEGDIVDVRYIDMLAKKVDAKAMRSLRADVHKRQGVTRYIDYCLVYLETDSELPNLEFIELLKPLAEAGLAFAQYDCGNLMLQEWESMKVEKEEARRIAEGKQSKKKQPEPDKTKGTVEKRKGPTKSQGKKDLTSDDLSKQISQSPDMSDFILEIPLPEEDEIVGTALNFLTRAAALEHPKAFISLAEWHLRRCSTLIVALQRKGAYLAEKKRKTKDLLIAATEAASAARTFDSARAALKEATKWADCALDATEAVANTKRITVEAREAVWDEEAPADRERTVALKEQIGYVKQRLDVAAKNSVVTVSPFRERLRALMPLILVLVAGAVVAVYVFWKSPKNCPHSALSNTM